MGDLLSSPERFEKEVVEDPQSCLLCSVVQETKVGLEQMELLTGASLGISVDDSKPSKSVSEEEKDKESSTDES